MFVDTHTHIYDPAFDGDRDATMARAIAAGVEMMILPNIDIDSIEPMKRLHASYPDNTRMAMGLHPTELGPDPAERMAIVERELRSGKERYVAVGEIGIDLYHDDSRVEEQMKVFEQQTRWASELGLPVIIHCREGLDQTLEVLEGLERQPQCVFHSFGGTTADAERIATAVPGAVFGINGVVTFRNSGLREVVPTLGIDRIVLETDSPYLSPVPYRGKRNESARIPLIASTIAESLGVSVEEVAIATTATARRIFGL